MSKLVNTDTFISEGPVGYYDLEWGTVEILLQNKFERVKCQRTEDRRIIVRVWGRTERGRCVWPLRVLAKPTGEEVIEVHLGPAPSHLQDAKWHEFFSCRSRCGYPEGGLSKVRSSPTI